MDRHENRMPRRAGLAAAAVAGLVASFLGGMAVAGGDPEAPRDRRPAVASALRLAHADLAAAVSCEDLLAWYVDRGVDRVTPWGWEDRRVYASARDEGGGLDVPTTGSVDSAPVPVAPQVKGATSSATGTNVQESGVDEPDLVKTDGTLLVRAEDDRLVTWDVSGTSPVRLATLDLPDLSGAEILLVGDTVVVVGTDTTSGSPVPDGGWSGPPPAGLPTRVDVVDVSAPAAPVITDTKVYSSALVTARQHGDVVRLVLSQGLPELDFVEPRMWRGEEDARDANREVVRDSELTDWLPTVTTYDGDEPVTEPLVDCADVGLPDDDSGLGTMTVVGFDASGPDPAALAAPDVTAVATASQIAYLSADRLYLATDYWGWGGPCCWSGSGADGTDSGTTHLHAFALSGTATTYVASGEVEGRVADRWAMDEADGVLRVAVGPTLETGAFNSIVTLAESGSTIAQLGRVDHLGDGEEIKSVRWFDDLALLVTFRQTDPLYAIDLSAPTRPRLIGELKIPGFSEYLHPLGSHRLIGVGQGADRMGTVRGAQLALFDVHDLAALRRLDVVGFGKNTLALAGLDPRQFTWLPDRRTALTVVAEGWEGTTGRVAVVRVVDGRLESWQQEVEYGTEVAQVRLVPLPSGRVVLVTGDDVTFFVTAPPG